MSEMTATGRLPRQLQRLIDARLDTIDRMLLGRLPRADRLAVTRDVEGQVYELLGERPGHELDREDVLTVLAKLDPPEAYIPEEACYEAVAVLLPSRTVERANRGTTESRGAMTVGIIGLLVLALVVLWPVTLVLNGGRNGVGMLFLYGETFLILAAGVPVFVLSIIWRRGGAWAAVGMVAGTLGLIAGLAAMALLLVL